jgi:hypothetical protein
MPGAIKVATYVSKFHYEKLEKLSKKFKVPKTRLIAIAIDKEMESKEPFKLNLGVVSSTTNEQDQAKLIQHLSTNGGFLTKEMLCLFRQQIGISDIPDLLKALEELIKRDIVKVNNKKGAPYYRVNVENLDDEAKQQKIEYYKNKIKQLEGE